MDHCQVLPPWCPLQAETAVVDSQQGLPCRSKGMVTAGQEPDVDCFLVSPHSIQIPHPCLQATSTYEAIPSDHPEQSKVLTRCDLQRSPRGLAWHQSSCGCMPPEDAVYGSTSQTHAIALCHMTSRASASTSYLHVIPIGVGRGIIRTISKNWGRNTIVVSILPQC